jgi:hypothetical protein
MAAVSTYLVPLAVKHPGDLSSQLAFPFLGVFTLASKDVR